MGTLRIHPVSALCGAAALGIVLLGTSMVQGVIPPNVSSGVPSQTTWRAVCFDSIDDMAAPGNCINASSMPQLGMLHPISESLFVEASGRVGVGTTAPSADLSVQGACTESLTGLVTVGAGSATVSGVGTGFTTELEEGNAVLIGEEVHSVATIISDTLLDLDATHSVGALSVTAFCDADLLKISDAAAEAKLVVDNEGRVGIGSAPTGDRLAVGGIVASSEGGFRFPDGSVQATAVASGDTVPAGVIVMWSGSTASIPSGWALCDGNNGTPGLQDRFIVAAGGSYGVGATGGQSTHSHGAGSFNLDQNSTGGSHITNMSAHGVSISGGKLYADTGTAWDWPQAKENVVGTSAASDHRPPYYALAYIMKM